MREEVELVHKQYRRDLVVWTEQTLSFSFHVTSTAERALMDFNRLTLKSQEAIGAAQELARRNGNPEITPEHLLLALLDQELPRTLPQVARAAVQPRGGRARRATPEGERRHAAAAGRRGVLARARPGRGRDAKARGRLRLD